jgi:hypothetical protein
MRADFSKFHEGCQRTELEKVSTFLAGTVQRADSTGTLLLPGKIPPPSLLLAVSRFVYEWPCPDFLGQTFSTAAFTRSGVIGH